MPHCNCAPCVPTLSVPLIGCAVKGTERNCHPNSKKVDNIFLMLQILQMIFSLHMSLCPLRVITISFFKQRGEPTVLLQHSKVSGNRLVDGVASCGPNAAP